MANTRVKPPKLGLRGAMKDEPDIRKGLEANRIVCVQF